MNTDWIRGLNANYWPLSRPGIWPLPCRQEDFPRLSKLEIETNERSEDLNGDRGSSQRPKTVVHKGKHKSKEVR
jgi:hypothetical protein